MKLTGGFFVWEADGWLNTLSADDICGHAFRNDTKEPTANIYVQGTPVEDVRILRGQEANDFHRLWMQYLEDEERARVWLEQSKEEWRKRHPEES